MEDTFRIDMRPREMQQRQFRDGNAMVFQSRTIIHNLDGTKEKGDWWTTSTAINWGDVYDKKPSFIDRLLGMFL